MILPNEPVVSLTFGRAALLTWVVTYPLVLLLLVRSVFGKTGMLLREYAGALLAPVLPTLAMGAFLALYAAAVPATTLGRLLLAILGGGGVYAACFWFLRRRYLLDTGAALRRRG